jgi:hypothetical protein
MMVESIESWCCRNDQRAFKSEVLKQRLEIISLGGSAAGMDIFRYNAKSNGRRTGLSKGNNKVNIVI